MDFANVDFTIGWYVLLLIVLLSIPFAIRIVRARCAVVQEEFEEEVTEEAVEDEDDVVYEPSTAEAPTAEAPTAEAPTAEASTAEAPTAEPSTAEASTAEAPVAEALSDEKMALLRNTMQDLDTQGFTIVSNTIPNSKIYELERAIVKDVHQTRVLDMQERGDRRFAIKLPLRSVYKKMVHLAYRTVKGVFDVLDDDPVVVDMSLMLVFPFADCDTWHTTIESKLEKSQRVVSFGIALDDLSENQGAFEVLPGSHRLEGNAYEGQSVDCDDTPMRHMCRYLSNVKGAISVHQIAGSMLVWDNGTYLRGGANTSGRVKRMLHFTLMYNLTEVPDGADLSLNSKKHTRVPFSVF